MKFTEIVWTEKMRTVMKDNAQILFLVGATGCSKSLVAGIKFADWLNSSNEDERQFFIVCKNRGTAVRNILDNKDSFYNLFSFCREPYNDSKVEGLYFKWHGLYGEKKVYILGADDKSAWDKFLGSNPDGIWLEELSVLNIDFLREAMGRAISRKCRLIGTTNGGLPTQEFYTEFVNHAQVQFRDSVPINEMSEMIEDKAYYHYYHFNLNDDTPHLTQEDRNKLKSLYPENSFYYMSKIMGCRGFVQGGAYAQLMEKSRHLVNFDDIELSNLYEIDLFIDVGSNKNAEDKSKASTIATLIGYSRECQRVIVLECWVVPATSHDYIIEFCEDKILWWWTRYMQKFQKIVIDSAESILKNTWIAKNKYKTIMVKGSVKSYKDIITLKTRCELKQQLLIQDRLLWTTHALNNYEAHTRILLDDDGKELDLSVQDNDMGDTLAYGLTEKWNEITKNIRR